MTPEKLLYTRKQAAAALAMSERRLDRLVACGDVVAVRDGRMVKFTAAELQRFVAALPAHEPGHQNDLTMVAGITPTPQRRLRHSL